MSSAVNVPPTTMKSVFIDFNFEMMDSKCSVGDAFTCVRRQK